VIAQLALSNVIDALSIKHALPLQHDDKKDYLSKVVKWGSLPQVFYDCETIATNSAHPIWKSVHEGMKEQPKALLYFGASAANNRNKHGKLPIHKLQHKDTLQYSLEHGVDANTNAPVRTERVS